MDSCCWYAVDNFSDIMLRLQVGYSDSTILRCSFLVQLVQKTPSKTPTPSLNTKICCEKELL